MPDKNQDTWGKVRGLVVASEGDKTPSGLKVAFTIAPKIFQLPPESGYFTEAVWSPDGRYIALPSQFGGTYVWDMRQQGPAPTLGSELCGSVWSATWMPDSRSLATGGEEGVICVWDCETGEMQKQIKATKKETYRSIWALRYSPDGNLLACTRKFGLTSVFDAQSGALVRRLDRSEHPRWSPDSTLLATDTSRMTPFIEKRGDTIASGGIIRIWSRCCWKVIREMSQQSRDFMSMAWSPDGQFLVSGCSEGFVHVWNAHSGSRSNLLLGHGNGVHGVAFSNCGRILGSCSWDKTVRFWRCDTWQPLAMLRVMTSKKYASYPFYVFGAPPVLAFHPKEPLVATTGSVSGEVNIWSMDMKRLFNGRVPRPMCCIVRAFLCHAVEDKHRVRELHKKLSKERGLYIWFDETDLLPGDDWRLRISKSIRDSDAVIVCLSKAAIEKSGFIHREMKLALEVAEEKPDSKTYVIPVRLEQCVVPEALTRWHWVDLFDKRGYQRLVKALLGTAAK
jgi:WD40 repeat protein